VIFLAAVTALTLVVLFVLSHRGSSDGASSARSRVESKSTSRRATTTIRTTTTLCEVSLNPDWPAKGTSRYSDSAASKSIGDQLSLVSTTTTQGSATTRGSATTLRRSTITTTTLRRLTTTTRVQPRVTAPPATVVATTTSPPAPPTTTPDATPLPGSPTP